jgi:hypothetical protein
LKNRVAFAVLVLLIGSVLSWSSGMALPWALLIAALAIFANGLIATWEDDLPGGFNNPDGTATPEYVGRVNALVRWAVGVVSVLTGCAIFAAARRGVMDWALALCLIPASISLGVGFVSRRRSLKWIALAFAIMAFAFATGRRYIT